jgi:hypothetical protein
MEIRSYRAVFDLERRIYRIDRLRLNPGGVPVRGVVYFLALLATVLVVGRVPLLRTLTGAAPWYLADLALPGASAALLTVIRIEGRPFHLAAQALVRYRVQPRRSAGLHAGWDWPDGRVGARWWPQEILMLPDGSDARMRGLRYTGPGAVLVTVAHVCQGRRQRRRSGRRRVLAGRAPIHRSQVTLRESCGASVVLSGGQDGQSSGREGGKVIALAPHATLRVGSRR